jgi:hypothetical protein
MMIRQDGKMVHVDPLQHPIPKEPDVSLRPRAAPNTPESMSFVMPSPSPSAGG